MGQGQQGFPFGGLLYCDRKEVVVGDDGRTSVIPRRRFLHAANPSKYAFGGHPRLDGHFAAAILCAVWCCVLAAPSLKCGFGKGFVECIEVRVRGCSRKGCRICVDRSCCSQKKKLQYKSTVSKRVEVKAHPHSKRDLFMFSLVDGVLGTDLKRG